MAKFLTGKDLDNKLTDIIHKAKYDLTILSPFIRLDEYCREVFKKLNHNPNLEIVIFFGKNKDNTRKSLRPEDLDFFKEFPNIVIIYCENLHAKYYANESEALLTSLNLLDQSMTNNIEYGISFNKSAINIDLLYKESIEFTNSLIKNSSCIFVKRPIFKNTFLGLSKKYIESKVIYDVTDNLYNNQYFKAKYYTDFDKEIIDTGEKITREEFRKQSFNQYHKRNTNNSESFQYYQKGYCIRCNTKISYDTNKPFCKECFYEWVAWENYFYEEKFCHCCGQNKTTSMSKPECLTCYNS